MTKEKTNIVSIAFLIGMFFLFSLSYAYVSGYYDGQYNGADQVCEYELYYDSDNDKIICGGEYYDRNKVEFQFNWSGI